MPVTITRTPKISIPLPTMRMAESMVGSRVLNAFISSNFAPPTSRDAAYSVLRRDGNRFVPYALKLLKTIGGWSLSRRPPPRPAPRPARADHHRLLPASHALAADLLDEGIEIVAAVVIGDLVAGLDVLDRSDLDDVLHEIDFRIRTASVVDAACPVPATGAVDRPALVELEKISRIEIVGDFGGDLLARVADDELALLDRDASEQAEPALGATDSQMTRR